MSLTMNTRVYARANVRTTSSTSPSSSAATSTRVVAAHARRARVCNGYDASVSLTTNMNGVRARVATRAASERRGVQLSAIARSRDAMTAVYARAGARRGVVTRLFRGPIEGDVGAQNVQDGRSRAWWRDVRVHAGSADMSSGDDTDATDVEDDNRPKSTPASLIMGVVARIVKPLQDFGFGRTRLWEGGVGLFMISGVGLAFILYGWIQGLLTFARKNSYQAFIEFPVACGIQVGTNVRIRGVKAGSVLSVQPSLEKVEVLVEMDDKNVPIPRNSLIEANQSGLIAETIIDITPAIPIPVAQWGPLDSGCEAEGVIVCDRGKIKGHPGVSMDELVGICTKLAREMERQDGMNKMFDTTDSARMMMTTLQPLLREAALIAQELRPMMQGVNEQGTLDTLELLAGQTSATVSDIRQLKQAILTDENQELLRQSISTLTKTLQHVEKVSGDISSVSGDPSTRANLRHLIQSLSRLVDA